uniref:G protein-coupled receptor n=1 Tax=Ditylenchus dipsaci TaxID=166011 RepID=A0A915CZX5_9BILA
MEEGPEHEYSANSSGLTLLSTNSALLDFIGELENDYSSEVFSSSSFRTFIAILVVTAAVLGVDPGKKSQYLLHLSNNEKISSFRLPDQPFILVLSTFYIHGDFRHFVANLAIVDIFCSILFAFMGYINLTNGGNFSIRVMTYSALAFYGSFGVMVCALVPISLSRIVAASRPKAYDKLFSGNRALLGCLLADMLPVVLLGVICISHHDIARYLFIGYAALTVLAYVLTFFLNFLVFRLVAQHIQVVECLHDRTRLLETKQVALSTLAQALVPLVCQVPAFLSLSSALLLMEPLNNENLIVITQLWLGASPLFDALITIFVIRQYRIQTIACCFGRKNPAWCCRKNKCHNRDVSSQYITSANH